MLHFIEYFLHFPAVPTLENLNCVVKIIFFFFSHLTQLTSLRIQNCLVHSTIGSLLQSMCSEEKQTWQDYTFDFSILSQVNASC